MTKTCIIHIGMPKTGTSSLQATLFAARETLLENEVNYFSYSENHNALAATFGRVKARASQSLIGINEIESDIKIALLEEVKSNTCSKFIISAESLGMIVPIAVENMYDLLKPYFDSFMIVCYVREPFGFARSAAQQHIKAGSVSEKLISNTLNRDQPGWGNVLPNYKRRLENYVKVFGKENIQVREFDRQKLKNQDIVDDFLIESLNYENDTSRLTRINTNVSLSASFGNLYEALNREIPLMIDGKVNPSRSVQLIARLKSFSNNHKAKEPYVLANLDIDKFLEVISSDLDWLRAEFDVTFNLENPAWDKQNVDLKEIALLTNFLSNLIDDAKIDMVNERTLRLQQLVLLREERNYKQFLQCRIQILNGKGKVEDFELITNKITNIEFLKSNGYGLNNGQHGVFYEVLERRIESLRDNSLG